MTYAIDGKQYIAVPISGPPGPAQLAVYKLPGWGSRPSTGSWWGFHAIPHAEPVEACGAGTFTPPLAFSRL